MTKWNEDENMWFALDDLMKNVKDDLGNFLGLLAEHRDEIGLLGNAVLFGGIGKLVFSYLGFRETNEPEQSLALAFQKVYADRRVQNLMGHAVNQAIDGKVSQMRGEI
jgi:hypothetical protein